MRAVRLVIAVLIVSPILMLALSESRFARQPFAQITAAPGPVPLTAPVAPGQPQPFSTIGALPGLAPAPGTTPAAVASAAASPRAFRCTCSAPGRGTEWAGVVASSSYFLASQSARGQCLSYLSNYNPGSAYLTPEGSAASGKPTIYNSTAFTQRRWQKGIQRRLDAFQIACARDAPATEALPDRAARGLIDKLFQIRRDRRDHFDVSDRRRIERYLA
jgi:hypothetical protein